MAGGASAQHTCSKCPTHIHQLAQQALFSKQSHCANAKLSSYLEEILIERVNAGTNAAVFPQPLSIIGVQGVAQQACSWVPHVCRPS